LVAFDDKDDDTELDVDLLLSVCDGRFRREELLVPPIKFFLICSLFEMLLCEVLPSDIAPLFVLLEVLLPPSECTSVGDFVLRAWEECSKSLSVSVPGTESSDFVLVRELARDSLPLELSSGALALEEADVFELS